jgi:hypothetical protein
MSSCARVDHRAEHLDHAEDAGDAPLVEGVDLDAAAAMSAWRSEKVRTRLALRARILLMFAEVRQSPPPPSRVRLPLVSSCPEPPAGDGWLHDITAGSPSSSKSPVAS